MDEITIIKKKIDVINMKQNIILEQLSVISRILAKQYNLPIEEGECEVDET